MPSVTRNLADTTKISLASNTHNRTIRDPKMDIDRIKRKRAVVRTSKTKLLNDIANMEDEASLALERICKRHAELLEDLAELVEVSVAEIGGMAHRHLRRTASLDAYMRITGVVKERVVCRPRDDERIQPDDLGEDCWEMVRRFLMLDDVEEAVIHPENR
ncbi:hypothetical protein HPB52_008549 [Rhipicephalus sanguineus]|uniref:Uncharacterized protein n=1 Tax=Rhipicephalus sanguineus TaxID=34632 RepID=A0A9D4Q6C7_RHISA|nr:hypothetical protein HPB52_008549 [Rhipicephalus sanguineus]